MRQTLPSASHEHVERRSADTTGRCPAGLAGGAGSGSDSGDVPACPAVVPSSPAEAPPRCVHVGPLMLSAPEGVGRQMRCAAKRGLVREAPGEARVYIDSAVPDNFTYRVPLPSLPLSTLAFRKEHAMNGMLC